MNILSISDISICKSNQATDIGTFPGQRMHASPVTAIFDPRRIHVPNKSANRKRSRFRSSFDQSRIYHLMYASIQAVSHNATARDSPFSRGNHHARIIPLAHQRRRRKKPISVPDNAPCKAPVNTSRIAHILQHAIGITSNTACNI